MKLCTATPEVMSARFPESAIKEAVVKAASDLGYKELYPKQDLVVGEFILGNDVFVCLPTGFGKSLCYCILPRTFDYLKGGHDVSTQHLVVIVSPLISLMKDQVRAMRERNISSVYVGEAEGEVENSICSGCFQLVFISPEALITDSCCRHQYIRKG